MKNINSTHRRDFLKQITIGTGALAVGLNGCSPGNTEKKPQVNQVPDEYYSFFNGIMLKIFFLT
jgi:hypothetical protein